MATLIARMRALAIDDEGQDLIEYALLAGLISLVAVATVTTAGEKVRDIFSTITTQLGTVK
jgi:pilus assembly protein Flp/PilA